jgi:hypothetical protein
MRAKQRYFALGLLVVATSALQAEGIKGTMVVTGAEMK